MRCLTDAACLWKGVRGQMFNPRGVASSLQRTCQALIIGSLLNHRRFALSSRRPPMHLRVPMRSDPTGPEQVCFSVQSPQQPLNLWEGRPLSADVAGLGNAEQHGRFDWLMPVTWCGVIPNLQSMLK